MIERCFESVNVLQVCFQEVWKLFDRCFMGVWMIFQECFNKLVRSFIGVSLVFQGRFMGISCVVLESLKGVSSEEVLFVILMLNASHLSYPSRRRTCLLCWLFFNPNYFFPQYSLPQDFFWTLNPFESQIHS